MPSRKHCAEHYWGTVRRNRQFGPFRSIHHFGPNSSFSIKAGTESTNHVAYGTLLLMARVGELAADNRGRPKKGEEKHSQAVNDFHKGTLVKYRKVFRHQQNGRVDEYFDAIAIGLIPRSRRALGN